tara:strand:- start:171 stop:989 length:819 start_codon:yes stop_codon:yes gene_type:complete
MLPERSNRIVQASKETEIEAFLELAFPPMWAGVAARIIETGATFAEGSCNWAPRWSQIPLTMRYGDSEEETAMKSVIFRVHDCLHQLWGLPDPKEGFSYYKKTQMAGEVAVLTLTEFVYAKWLYYSFPEFRQHLLGRHAIPMIMEGGPLAHANYKQLATRLDSILHKKAVPTWVRDCESARLFRDDYLPMLETDRAEINVNWSSMARMHWNPKGASIARFGKHLDGLELTLWMIDDFEHLLNTDSAVDEPLKRFNVERRSEIVLPEGWASYS